MFSRKLPLGAPDIFLISDRVLLAVHVLVHFTTMDFINLVSARLKDLFGTELGDGCPSLQTPPGRLTRTFPRVN